MTIAIKAVRDARLDFGTTEIEFIGHHSASIRFEAGEFRYHVWLSQRDDGTWCLGDTLYRNRIEPTGNYRDPRDNTTRSKTEANWRVIGHVLDAAGITDGTALDSAKITAMMETHNQVCRERKAAERAETNAARAAVIRAALFTFMDGDRITQPNTMGALAIIAGNASDDELNALDHLFNCTI